MSMASLRTGYSGDTSSLPSLMGPQNDWEIAPMDIEILRRDDGSPWELGAGAFGKVRAPRGPVCGFHSLSLKTCGHLHSLCWCCRSWQVDYWQFTANGVCAAVSM